MSAFTDTELAYLRSEQLKARQARLEMIGEDGEARVVRVEFGYDETDDVIEIGAPAALHIGAQLPLGEPASADLVVDDLASIDPWHPRGVEVSGEAEAFTDPPRIRLRPERVRSWGLG